MDYNRTSINRRASPHLPSSRQTRSAHCDRKSRPALPTIPTAYVLSTPTAILYDRRRFFDQFHLQSAAASPLPSVSSAANLLRYRPIRSCWAYLVSSDVSCDFLSEQIYWETCFNRSFNKSFVSIENKKYRQKQCFRQKNIFFLYKFSTFRYSKK